MKLIFLILIVSSTFNFVQVLGDENNPTEKLDRLFRNYDKRIRPNHGGPPVEVGVTAYVLSMPQVDSSSQTFTVNLYFRQTWKDPRLVFNDNGNESLVLDGPHWEKLWVPDTFMVNEINSKLHEMTVPNVFAFIRPSGEVLKSGRYTIELACPMDTSYFPFDEQICNMEIESYAHTMKDISFKWAKGTKTSFGVSPSMSNAKYFYSGHRASEMQFPLSTGNYSRLNVELWITRASGRYIIEFFTPCIILTILALVSLFISDNRTAILVNTLAMGVTILFLTVSTGLMDPPTSSSVNSLDNFAALTYFFLFSTLFACVLDLYLSKRSKSSAAMELRNMERGQSERRLVDEEVNQFRQNSPRTPSTPSSKLQNILQTVENICIQILPVFKILLVISYALANLIYWSVHPSAGTLRNTARDELMSQDWNLS